MLIRVMYENGKFDMVKPRILDGLLEKQRVSGFMRSEGWADVKKDFLRGSKQPSNYHGPERRNPLHS